MAGPSDRATKRVKSADRALSVIELVSQFDGISFTEITERLSLPRSSAHALLTTLVDAQWIRVANSRYRLGIRAWLVGRSPAAYDVLVTRVRGVLREVTVATGETAQFAVLSGDACIYLAISHSLNPMRLFSEEGSRLAPYATAVGRAMLATLPDEAVERFLTNSELIALTPNTMTDPDKLRDRIIEVRDRGYETESEEYIAGSMCVAAAVGSIQELGMVCGISITTPTYRRPDDWPAPHLDALRDAVSATRAILAAGSSNIPRRSTVAHQHDAQPAIL